MLRASPGFQRRLLMLLPSYSNLEAVSLRGKRWICVSYISPFFLPFFLRIFVRCRFSFLGFHLKIGPSTTSSLSSIACGLATLGASSRPKFPKRCAVCLCQVMIFDGLDIRSAIKRAVSFLAYAVSLETAYQCAGGWCMQNSQGPSGEDNVEGQQQSHPIFRTGNLGLRQDPARRKSTSTCEDQTGRTPEKDAPLLHDGPQSPRQ